MKLQKTQIKPVFYDPKKRRKRYLMSIFGILLIGIFFGVLSVIAGIVVRPVFPTPTELSRAIEDHHYKHIFTKLTKSIQPHASIGASTTSQSGGIDLSGFFAEWDDAAFSSLKQNISSLNTLIPDEILFNASGALSLRDAKKFERTKHFIDETDTDLRVFPLLSNYNQDSNSWDAKLLHATLSNYTARNRLVQEIRNFLATQKMAGVNIDFEDLLPETFPFYYQFLESLAQGLHADGRELTLDVPVGDMAYDFKRLAGIVDSLVLMLYDEHWLTSKPGSVAGYEWFAKSLKTILLSVPAGKVTVAVGNYGYDWKK